MIVIPSAEFEVHYISDMDEFRIFVESKGLHLDIIDSESSSGFVADQDGPTNRFIHFSKGEYFFVGVDNTQQFFARPTLNGFKLKA